MEIDLNKPPSIHESHHEEELSILVTPSSSGNIIISLNNDNNEIQNSVLELDLNQLNGDDNELWSDSSDEEIDKQPGYTDDGRQTGDLDDGQQTGDNDDSRQTRDTDDEQQNEGNDDGREREDNDDGREREDNDDSEQGNIRGRRRKRELTNAERWTIYRTLLEKSVDGKLKKNTTKEVKDMFNVESLRTIQRIWKIHKKTPSGVDVDVSSRKTRNCGRKRIEVDLSRVLQIELHQRTTLASLSNALGVSSSKLYDLFKQGVLRRHSSAIKPHLKEENKTSRIEFCLSMIDESTMPNDPKFKKMYNYVHIDEKWFYLTKKDQTYYLLANEADPDRSCQSKNFIAKVMFLAATARPRFDDEGRVIFSGKIGCWPFVTEQAAQRSSRNRQAGTMEMKAITCVKRETIKKFLIEKVIPAIREKWPRLDYGETIFIQQDNARTHVPPTDPEFLLAASQDGFNIRLTCQPPNSPDLNILDLGFFRAIQSLQQKMRARTIPELVQAVEKAYDDFSPIKLNYVWLTLHLCMKETMKLGGGNRYKIPHINKKRLQMMGFLPTQISCEPILLQETKDFLATRMGTSSSGATHEEA